MYAHKIQKIDDSGHFINKQRHRNSEFDEDNAIKLIKFDIFYCSKPDQVRYYRFIYTNLSLQINCALTCINDAK